MSSDTLTDSELSSSSSSSPSLEKETPPKKTSITDNNDGLEGPIGDHTRSIGKSIAKSKLVPKSLEPYIETITNILGTIIDVFELIIPSIEKLWGKAVSLWITLTPYNPELLIPAALGLLMCFFGGHFLTLIAAIEAYRMIGFQSTWDGLKGIYSDLHLIAAANKKDDTEDENNDGVADVKQMSGEKLAARKTLLILRTVDPTRLQTAIMGINAGFIAVIATLKVQFAKSITLGHAIAHTMSVPVNKFISPIIESLMPTPYRKWVSPSLNYIVNMTAISIAWWFQRVISAFHSAIRGGLMCARCVLAYLVVKKYIPHIHLDETYLDELAGYALATAGFIYQLSANFHLPFPLNVLLFPFTLAEHALVWIINQY